MGQRNPSHHILISMVLKERLPGMNAMRGALGGRGITDRTLVQDKLRLKKEGRAHR